MDIKNRIVLMNILPTEWTLTDMIIIKELKEKLNFSQEEIEKREIKTNENWSISWQDWKDKDIQFNEAEKSLINKSLNKLDREWKVAEQHIELFNIFK